MEGRNTFGCLVNGKVFFPKAPLGQSGVHAEFSNSKIDTMAINIYAGNRSQSFFISILDSPSLETGRVYDLSNKNCCGIQYIEFDDKHTCDYEIALNGFIKLSIFDLNKSIVSGTFEFITYNSNCSDTIKVTEGRFDIGEITR